MKTIKTTLLALVALTLTACTDSKDEPVVPESNDIQLEQTEYIVPDAGSKLTITVGGNVYFNFNCNEDWIDIRRDSEDYHTIYVFISPNETYDSRTAVITLSKNYSDTKADITIVQAQKDAIVLAASEYSMISRECSFEFPVLSNIDFEYESDSDWLTIVNPKSRGLEESIIRVTAKPNDSDAARTATVTFRHGSIEQKLLFVQNGTGDHMAVALTHSDASFALELTGADASQVSIDWGDGTAASDATSHEYSSAGTHTVTLDSYGTETVKIPQIGSLTSFTIFR